MENLIDKLGFYVWVICVGFIGGVLGAIGSDKKKIVDGVVGTFTSMFLGWIGYEVVNAWLKDEKIALATCGFVAWRGAEWIRGVVDEMIKAKLEKNQDNTNDY